MSENFIHETAKCVNSTLGAGVKLFRNAEVYDSELSDNVSIGDDTNIRTCKLAANVVINRRNYINNSRIGEYTYTGLNTICNYAEIGRFCSFARNVDVGGFDHDIDHVTTMPTFRFQQMNSGKTKAEATYEEYCQVGNDVWIAAGAQILHKAKIGDGAVIGAGAIVTKDVPPYAVVAGVPGKILKFRFDEKTIERLMNIQWWNWPIDVILENIEWMINAKMNDEILSRMEEIGRACKQA